MRRIAVFLVVLGLAAMPVGKAVRADPVVVELFTSQGCSSCPPADALLKELAADTDILPLALHVDYWDYLGWQDSFGSPAFTNRQKNYARVSGRMMVYTPQMIVDGRVSIAGYKPGKVMAAIMSAQGRPSPVEVAVRQDGDRIAIRLTASERLPGAATVILVHYLERAEVTITRGENAGRAMAYSNVVTDWIPMATWTGEAPMVLEAPALPTDRAGAVLVQQADYGPFLAAARLP